MDRPNETCTTEATVAKAAVLVKSSVMPPDSVECRGHEFNLPTTAATTTTTTSLPSNSYSSSSTAVPVAPAYAVSVDDLMTSFMTTGFQATNLALAVERVHELRQWRLSDTDDEKKDRDSRTTASITTENDDDKKNNRRVRARIFLAFTSNQISCGQREVLRFLVQHGMVDVLITTAGGIEEDIIKCFQPTYMGDFHLSGRTLRQQGLNRIGNLIIPNQNYCAFEDWLAPILDAMHNEQDAENLAWAQSVATAAASTVSPGAVPTLPQNTFVWTPSGVIRRLGLEINHPDSVLYWAAQNQIPVFCPALTDGSFGDMLYFHSYKRQGFVLDIAADIRRLNDLAVRSHCTGQIILGGGLVKHHTCNANLMRNGADYSVYINTANDFDGSDSGASPDEAKSWGKIRLDAKPVKVTADATIAFPLLVACTFAKDVEAWKESVKDTVCWMEDLAP